MPRRLIRPEPPLTDDAIWLEPLATAHVPDLAWVLDGDPDITRFTRIPSEPGLAFLTGWLARYERAWEDGSAAGFAARDTASGAAVGFAGLVTLDLDRQEGEIGYAVAPHARGRGVARRSLDLLTRWGFETLGLQRIELRIDPANEASLRIAQRAGYRHEGTLRNLYFKEGLRSDTAVWSRLAGD